MKGTGKEHCQGSSPQTQRTSSTPLQLSGHAPTCRYVKNVRVGHTSRDSVDTQYMCRVM